VKYISTILFILFFHQATLQGQDFKQTLTVEELELFKEDLQFKYRLFYESVLSIINDDFDIQTKYNSRSVLIDIFSTTKSTVADYLDYASVKTLPITKYSYELFELENRLPLYYKKFKLSDSMYVESSTKSINEEFIDLPADQRNQKMFQVYKGKLFFIERIIDSKIEGERFDFGQKEDLKYVSFRIIHNEDNEYEVEIESIDFVQRNNSAYDYDKIKNEVLDSSKPWTDVAQKEYLSSIKDEAFDKGIIIKLPDDIVPSLAINPDILALATEVNLLKPVKLKVWDYVIPGIGHLKFDDPKAASVYGATFLGTLGAGVFYRWNSTKFYNMADELELEMNIGQSDLYNSRGDREITRSNVSFIAAGSIAFINLFHIGIRSSKKRKLLEEAQGLSSLELKLGGNQYASLIFKF